MINVFTFSKQCGSAQKPNTLASCVKRDSQSRLQSFICLAKSPKDLSSQDPPLKAWQEQHLRQALKKSRKSIEISRLCHETHLERRRVLQWLKNPPEAPTDKRDVEREQPWAQRGSRVAQPFIVPQYDRQSSRDETPIYHTQRGTRKFNKAVLSTLETVYENNEAPDDEIIYSIVDLHHVQKRQVLDWFAGKRRQARKDAGLQPRPPTPPGKG